MRLAVISDIHGNLVALEAVLADLKALSVDDIVNLGDCVTGPLWPRETMELLDTLKLPTVRGEQDRWLGERAPSSAARSAWFTHDALTASQRRRLGELPPYFDVCDGVLAVHGSPRDDMEYLMEDDRNGRLTQTSAEGLAGRLGPAPARVILCGHSHLQHAMEGSDGCLLVNPGSVGGPPDLQVSSASPSEYQSPHARFAVLTWDRGRITVDMIAIEYDWTAAARRARENGRQDWAQRLLEPV